MEVTVSADRRTRLRMRRAHLGRRGVSPQAGPIKRLTRWSMFSTAKCNRLLDCEQISLIAAYHEIDSKSGTGRMAAGLWQVGLWQEGGQAAYSQGQFRSVFSVKLFVELSRPRPDFIDILAPTDASSADVDWIEAELSRADRHPSSFKIANTSSRATHG
jgi:hypothetical protein